MKKFRTHKFFEKIDNVFIAHCGLVFDSIKHVTKKNAKVDCKKCLRILLQQHNEKISCNSVGNLLY